ncbi:MULTISPECIES: tellurite resistance/C4-dicarboxylate transporter family protein [unclassified Streptomyces]|uniref:tellurite resistance/C4-dicarboxylate transporter family protein n=1 Tax=unclassified Streptomyces TaxID=2593676 RepID=UPI0040437DB2
MPGISGLRAWWAERSPAAGSAVMATGILSIGLGLTGAGTLSRAAFALAWVTWVALAAAFVLRLVAEPRQWMAEAESPGALTSVAATTVLGTRTSAAGARTTAEALLALAALLCPVLLLLVVRRWGPRMPGSVFLCCVATQGLAVLAADLAAAERAAWLAHTALVVFWLGLVLYGVALTRFDAREVLQGAGDHWVAGGALGISALAGARLLTAGDTGLYLWNADDRDVLRTVTVILLVLDVAWYAVLVAAEAVRPRRGYHVLRWATVFPMGMTAVAVLSVASAVGVTWLTWPGRLLLWVAVAAWLVVAAGALLAARGAGGGTGVRSTGRR